MENIMMLSERVNTGVNTVARKSFLCLYVRVFPNSAFGAETVREAERILPNLNRGAANSSMRRSESVMAWDNLSGVLAERICEQVLKTRYANGNICRVQSDTAVNQIDLTLCGRTIEVRSSGIKNGIDFALFSKAVKHPDAQYIDVIGPYSNGYKPGEAEKDYYMRVLYPFSITEFMERWRANGPVEGYLTGGATRAMMNDSTLYRVKHLIPKDGTVSVESDYRTIAMAKSLDIHDFFAVLERENPELLMKKGAPSFTPFSDTPLVSSRTAF